MGNAYKAVKVTDRVYWVGAVDWGLREFHGYATGRGTTYNAYLVLADKVTLIDTVKAPFKDELLARIASVVDHRKIDYIVSNHSEMDHTGCLPQVIEAVRPEKVFASVMGVKALGQHFHMKDGIEAVQDGQTLSLGNMDLTCVETRMLHWPDSMVSFLSMEDVLFSQDAFGMHLATGERFADEVPADVLLYEAAKYYANIIMPFAPVVLKTLEKLSKLNWPIQMIAPDHGPIYRKDLNRIMDLYRTWADKKPGRKAVVAYDTMWGSTARMAGAIAEGLIAGGAAVKVMPLSGNHRSDVATEVLDAGALLVGSPTLNNGMLPTVADLLTYLKGLKPTRLIGAVFGSYGWSGKAVGQVAAILDEMKVDLVGEPMEVCYVPDEEALAKCYAIGQEVARKMREVGKG
jgi:flavorubredoxin